MQEVFENLFENFQIIIRDMVKKRNSPPGHIAWWTDVQCYQNLI